MQQIASLEPVGRPRQVPKVLDAQRSTNAAFGIVMPITPSRLVPVSRPPHYRQATTYVIGTRGNVAHPARGTPWRCSRPMGRGHSVRDGAASARGERACRSRGTSSSTNRMPPTIPPSRRAPTCCSPSPIRAWAWTRRPEHASSSRFSRRKCAAQVPAPGPARALHVRVHGRRRRPTRMLEPLHCFAKCERSLISGLPPNNARKNR